MSEPGTINSEEVGEYTVRVEHYDEFVACTVWGPHTPDDIRTVGDDLFSLGTVLKQTSSRLPEYTVWGLARRGISTDDGFVRFDSDGPAITYQFYDDRVELGILIDDVADAHSAFEPILPPDAAEQVV